MELCSIASGSSGNCIYVGTENGHILVDAGISGKRIEEGLNSLSKANNEIVNDITTLSAATEEVTASAQQSTELTEDNYRSAIEAKEILDNILEVSHEMDVYIL